MQPGPWGNAYHDRPHRLDVLTTSIVATPSINLGWPTCVGRERPARETSSLHFATYFDQHFLTRGLALYHSLARHSPRFTLWVLCLDRRTEAVLRALDLPGVELVPLADLERADPDLVAARPSRSLVEYYWTCGPAYLLYLLRQHPEIEQLVYTDADQYVLSNPAPLVARLGKGDVGLTEARPTPTCVALIGISSRFNVGFNSFRRSSAGQACLAHWREQCLEWCYARQEGSRYGDQGYLDAWPEEQSGVVVLDVPSCLGPWNVAGYDLTLDGERVLANGEPVVTYHFTMLRAWRPWLFEPGLIQKGARLTPALRRGVYIPYLRELRRMARLARGVDRAVPMRDLIPLRGTQPTLFKMLRRRSCLVVTNAFAL